MNRSETMRRVPSKDTKPELIARKLLSQLGYRYRLHRKDIQGNPDIAFIGRRKLIFVNGCFWHGHSCKRGARIPKANREYWEKKIRQNMTRDRENIKSLSHQGWEILTVWECETKDTKKLSDTMDKFLARE